MLLILTVLLFGRRCYQAGVFAMFGRYAATGQALGRLAIAASLPALLCTAWFTLNPELSAWAWLGAAHFGGGLVRSSMVDARRIEPASKLNSRSSGRTRTTLLARRRY